MIDISPQTDREKLIAEMAHAQGFQEGVRIVTEMIVNRDRAALQQIGLMEQPKLPLRVNGV